jgi:hypothetical protein
MLGGQGAATALSRITTWLGGTFLALALLISILSGPSDQTGTSLMKEAADQSPAVQGTELEIPTLVDNKKELSTPPRRQEKTFKELKKISL